MPGDNTFTTALSTIVDDASLEDMSPIPIIGPLDLRGRSFLMSTDDKSR